MRLRWLLAFALLLLPGFHRAAAVRPADLPTSGNGELDNCGNSGPGTFPLLYVSYNPTTLLPTPVVSLPVTQVTDTAGNSFYVHVDVYDWGSQVCSSTTSMPTEVRTSGAYTILNVYVTPNANGAPSPQKVALTSFQINLQLNNPKFVVCTSSQWVLCNESADGLPTNQGLSYAQPLFEPAPSPGADGGTATAWSFGPIYDPNQPGDFLYLNSNESNSGAIGNQAVLVAGGTVLCSTPSVGPCNNISASTTYSLSFIDPLLVTPTTLTAHGGYTPPTTISASANNVSTNPITISNGTLSAIYNASTNYPVESTTATPVPPAPVNSSGTSDAITYTCSAVSVSPLYEYRPVWLQYTPTVSTKVAISTAGSHYDTVLSVPSLSLCNDDTDPNAIGAVTSSLNFSVTQGTTYQILVTEYPPCSSAATGTLCPIGGAAGTFVAPLSGDSTLYFNLATPQIIAPSTIPPFASTIVGQTSAVYPTTLSSSTGAFGATGVTGITAATTGDFHVTPASCTSPLVDQGTPCTLNVTFVPTAAGTRTGTLVISSSGTMAAGNTPFTIQLSGTGVAATPAVGFSPPTTLAFATSQVINTTSPISDAILTNTGTGPLTVTAVTPSGDFSQTNNCISSSPIAANGTCTVMVTFTPTATGTRTGQLTFTDNASNSPQMLGLSGTGIAASQTITFTPLASPVTFGAAPVSLSATSTSGLAVAFTVQSGPGSISGSTLSFTGAGTVVVAANQAGNANYNPAPQVTQSVTVNKATPAVTFTASPNPILIQNTLTLNATVASPAGTPTGSVAFSDGTTPLTTVPVTAGVATLTISTLAAGSHSLSAVYSGDNNFNTNNGSYSETIEDFTLTTGSSGGSQTVAPGGTANYTLPMTPSGGTTFPAAVTFTTSGVPTGFTASFNPASLAAGSSATNVALMIQVPTSAVLQKPAPSGRALTLLAFALLLPILGGIRRAHPRLRRLALAILLLVAAGGSAAITGCGGSSGGGGGGGGGTTTQTYTITVTATSGALSHSTTVTLIVN